MSKRRQRFVSPPSKGFRGRRMPGRRVAETTVRSAAAWALERTLSSHSPSSTFLESALSQCQSQDHGLLRELLLGSLRWLRRIDHVLSLAANRSMDRIEPMLQPILRIGAYQLLFLDRIPAHAAVHEAVEEARRRTHRGGGSFTNAVLRRIARNPQLDDWPVEAEDPMERLAIETSHPTFLVRRWYERLGEASARALLMANNRPKAMSILAFRDRGGREPLAEAFIDQGFEVAPSELAPDGLVVTRGNPLKTAAYCAGTFYLQDEASQAAALVPPPVPGERILDAASAPGGKAFALLAFEPSVQVLLADVSVSRTVGVLRDNLKRLGRALPVLVGDAGQPAVGTSFDRVVLDLPCSGTGTLRKHPELKWRIQPSEIGRLARQSGRMLDGLAERVKVGGMLIAITCSIEPEENEDVVDRFLARRPDFARLDLEGRLPFPLERWVCGSGQWQILPADHHDGFTLHALIRRPSAS